MKTPFARLTHAKSGKSIFVDAALVSVIGPDPDDSGITTVVFDSEIAVHYLPVSEDPDEAHRIIAAVLEEYNP